MAPYNKFDQFTLDVVSAKHDFASHVFKVMLTNTSPVATNQVKANLIEIAAGNGYAAGGNTVTISATTNAGTVTVTGADVIFSATGAVGPFRYAVLYNDTQAAPAKPLIAWWDYGTAITLAATETLTVDFDALTGIFQMT